MELVRAQAYRAPADKSADIFGQRFRAGKGRAANQDRDRRFAQVQRGCDLNRDEVFRIAGAGGELLRPARPDDGQQHTALRDLPGQPSDKPLAGLDIALHVHEDVVPAKLLLKPHVKRADGARIVAAPVIDEDFGFHAFLVRPGNFCKIYIQTGAKGTEYG